MRGRPLDPGGTTRFVPNLNLAPLPAAPIAVVAGTLGVGPGFLLLPTLIVVGVEPGHAAAVNALAVTPPSFSALLSHIVSARADLTLAAVLVVIGAIGSFAGARMTGLYVPDKRLTEALGVLIVVMTAYKLLQMLSH